MKFIISSKAIAIVLIICVPNLTVYAASFCPIISNKIDRLGETYINQKPEFVSVYISHERITQTEQGNSENLSAPRTTIFIGGASFKGKEKPDKKDDLFSQNLWYWFKRLFHGKGHYRTSNQSTRFLGIIRNSLYSMKFGNKPIDQTDMKKRKHKVLRKVIDEISLFYAQNGGSGCPNINLVGSSYGSVVAANLAIKLAEFGYKVETLTLSASPIPKDNSVLAQKLMTIKNNGLIGKIIWHPNGPGDTVTGASGNTSVWKLMFPNPSSGNQSIILPSHPHNAARAKTERTGEIIVETLINNDSEGPILKQIAQDSLTKIQN